MEQRRCSAYGVCFAGILVLGREPFCKRRDALAEDEEDPDCEILRKESLTEPEQVIEEKEEATKQSRCRVSSVCLAGIELTGRAPLCTINNGGLVEENPNCEILQLYKEWLAELED